MDTFILSFRSLTALAVCSAASGSCAGSHSEYLNAKPVHEFIGFAVSQTIALSRTVNSSRHSLKPSAHWQIAYADIMGWIMKDAEFRAATTDCV
jgi:hypothetical protein